MSKWDIPQEQWESAHEFENDRLNFILQTSKDYDIPFDTVEKIWNQTTGNNEFYNMLEIEINKGNQTQ